MKSNTKFIFSDINLKFEYFSVISIHLFSHWQSVQQIQQLILRFVFTNFLTNEIVLKFIYSEKFSEMSTVDLTATT